MVRSLGDALASLSYNDRMPPRTLAIGDIHGCSTALAALIQSHRSPARRHHRHARRLHQQGPRLKGRPRSTSRFEKLLQPDPDPRQPRQHDARGLGRRKRIPLSSWKWAAVTTLDSYGDSGRLDLVPAQHWEFLRSCSKYYETATHFFCHANYDPARALWRIKTTNICSGCL